MTYALMIIWKYFAITSQLVCFIRAVELGNYSGLLLFYKPLKILITVFQKQYMYIIYPAHAITRFFELVGA